MLPAFITVVWLTAGPGNVSKDCYVNPCTLQGDFDGDGKSDEAIAVVETTAPRRRGVALVMGTGKTFVLGAGTAIGNGGADFEWMDTWRVLPRTEAVKHLKGAAGDGLIVEKSESAGGLIGFVKGRPRWKQWSD
jgi:hypothetical protein